jgi:site-specific DNA-methyltransferase (adenine-specific)
MSAPYWTDGSVTLYHGDCREITEWLTADALVTDPPYGRGWKQGLLPGHTRTEGGIVGDEDTSVRDAVLRLGDRPAIVFGDLMLAPPAGTRQVLIYRKPRLSGMTGTTAGWQRNAEAIYLLGPWPSGWGGRDSIISTGSQAASGANGMARRYGHPHAKPVDVMETLIAACPPGAIADPTSGAGSTLIAARNQGRPATGVELDERYCEMAARRLSQPVMDFGEVVA